MRASGGDLILSGVGKKGLKIGASYKVSGKIALVQARSGAADRRPTRHEFPKIRNAGQKSNILVMGNVTGPVRIPNMARPWRRVSRPAWLK